MSSIKFPNGFVRLALGGSMVAAGIMAVVGVLSGPYEGDLTNGDWLQAVLQYQGRAIVSATVLHYAFLLLVPAAIGLYLVARERSPRLAGVGVVLAVIGAVDLSSAVFTDFMDLALVQSVPLAQARAVDTQLGSDPGALLSLIPGVFGTFLGLILMGIALWRGRLVGAWYPAATIVGCIDLQFILKTHQIPQLIGFVLLFAPIAYVGFRLLHESTDGAQAVAEAAESAAA